MDPRTEIPLSISAIRAQATHSGCRSLPPANAFGTQHVLPSYPSSMLHYYRLPSHHVANYAHIPTSTFQQPFSSHRPADGGAFGPLPSVSQSHLPSIRCTPSSGTSHAEIPDPHHALHTTSFPDHRPIDNTSRISQRIQSTSRTAVNQHQPVPVLAAPQPVRFTSVPILSPHPHLPPNQPIQPTLLPTVPINQHSYISSSHSTLPSTKDIPFLSGRHDWAPWHSAVRTLILNSNLLGHIADDPLPGAFFDPGLWPTYPPVIHRGSTQAALQSFTDWWSQDGLASHILTSRLNPSILGCLPIANERMGQRRSARTVYLTLRHQFGAGDYSAVMVIEARLRQLKCLPTRGGVHITEFITTWRTIKWKQQDFYQGLDNCCQS
jgi:hypothetical protein